MSAIQATGKRYIIKAVELKKESAGGIILKSSDETQLAQIVSIGLSVDDPLPENTFVIVDWNHTVPLRDGFFVVDSRAVQAVVEK